VAFPLTLRGEVILSAPTAGRGLRGSDAVARLAAALEAERPSGLERDGREVRFRADLFRWVSNWNLLVPIDRGVFIVAETPVGLHVSYELSFRRLCTIVTCMVALILGPVVLMTSEPALPWWHGLSILLGSWSWLFGGNYLLSAVRVPRFVRRALAVD
jgi:hypothetical protein